jgi:hypothetical protein
VSGKTVQLLVALQDSPQHGYSIAQWAAKVDPMVRWVILPDYTDACELANVPFTLFYCGKSHRA